MVLVLCPQDCNDALIMILYVIPCYKTGLCWRTKEDVKLKGFNIGVYVHEAKKDNTVWYDDVMLSTGYIGPDKAK